MRASLRGLAWAWALTFASGCLSDLSGTQCNPGGTCGAGYTCCYGTCTPASQPCVDCCVSGTCPTATEVAGLQRNPLGISVSEGWVYWANNATGGGIGHAPLDGGSASVLVASDFARRVVATPQGVFWTFTSGLPDGGFDGGVAAASLDGLQVSTLVSGQQSPTDIDADDMAVYWESNNGGVEHIFTARQQGTPNPAIGMARTFQARAVRHQNGLLYWAEHSEDPMDGGDWGQVRQMPTDQTMGPVDLADHEQVLTDAVDPAYIYWANGTAAGHDIFRTPLDGGAPELLTSWRGTATDMAVDTNALYWIGGDGGVNADGWLRVYPFDGSGPRCLTEQLRSPFKIALTGSAVYWTDNAANGVFSAAR